MNSKVVSPYGDWMSPITINTIIGKSRALSDPRVGLRSSNTGYYLESRENGENTIMRATEQEVAEVLPKQYSAGNSAYEYGGSTYEVLNNGKIIFTHGKDNTVNILDPESHTVDYLTGNDPVLRYSDFSPNLENPWVLAYQEDHTRDSPADIRAYVVAINIETAEVKRIISGADFYYTPRFNPDGTKLVWIQWNRQDMLFDNSELYMASFDSKACEISGAQKIVGKGNGLAEPHWGPDGTLWYCAEKYQYRSLFRLLPDSQETSEVNCLGLQENHIELGEHGLSQGSRTYTPLSSSHVVAAGYCNGTTRLLVIDVNKGSYDVLLDPEVHHLRGRSIARLDDANVLLVAEGCRTPKALRKVNIKDGHSVVLRTATDDALPESVLSQPEPIQIDVPGPTRRSTFGFLWMPKNEGHVAPAETRPPLIIDMHGGPTGAFGPGLDLQVQYFTSRGYAYLKHNYTGSVGHGREYRQSLFGNWGVFDCTDAAALAEHLRKNGRVGKVGITGISAGGYGTLQCVTRYPDIFDAGYCVYGVADLAGFDKLTHKLEMDYAATLVLQRGMSEEEKAKAYKERSAIYHVDKIKTPLAFLHSREDTVVPISQAELMFDALKDQIDAKLVKFSGEGHSMGKPATVKLWISEGEAWWKTHLL
ncbi:prolyl oligopeptidase [Sarocladium strictum]